MRRGLSILCLVCLLALVSCLLWREYFAALGFVVALLASVIAIICEVQLKQIVDLITRDGARHRATSIFWSEPDGRRSR